MALFRRRQHHVVDQKTDLEHASKPAPVFEPGVPGRCPMCDGFGYIDHIDMINRLQSQHCRTCGHVWEFRFDGDHEFIDLTDPTVTEPERAESSRSRHTDR